MRNIPSANAAGLLSSTLSKLVAIAPKNMYRAAFDRRVSKVSEVTVPPLTSCRCRNTHPNTIKAPSGRETRIDGKFMAFSTLRPSWGPICGTS